MKTPVPGVFQAIYDPGILAGPKGDRSLTQWQTDAVCAALSSLAPVETAATEPVACRRCGGIGLVEWTPPEGYVLGYDDIGRMTPCPVCSTQSAPPGDSEALGEALTWQDAATTALLKMKGECDLNVVPAVAIAQRVVKAIRASRHTGDSGALREALRADAEFLLDRLDDLELDSETIFRDWNGHVYPAMARLRTALSKGEPGK